MNVLISFFPTAEWRVVIRALGLAWATDAGSRQCWLEMDLGKPETFDRVAISEYEPRVRSFELQTRDGGDWKTFYRGTTMGRNFAARFKPLTAQHVRLNILDASNGPTIYEFQLFASAAQKRRREFASA